MSAVAPTLWQRLRYTRLRDVLRGRFDASLDWRLVVAEADLPVEIRDVVNQVVRRTRLWRNEKVDVAAELVAHFQDGLEAAQSVAELVKSFGDPQQAARLIRRAKKRSRPLLWHICHYALLALMILVAAYFIAGLYMLFGRPSIKTDYLAIINQRAMSVPEEERAWPLYRDALLAMGVNLAVRADTPAAYKNATAAKPGDDGWPKAEQFLRDHDASLTKLREAASRQHLGFVTSTAFDAVESDEDQQILGAVGVSPERVETVRNQTIVDRPLIDILLPDVQLLNTAASLLANDARRAARAGDGDIAMADVVALFGISHHCEEKPFFVSLLAANAVQRQAFAVIQETLTEHPDLWTDAQLRDLAHKIAAAQIDWRRGAEGERAFFNDLMQRLYTDDGSGDGRLVLQVGHGQNLFDFLDSVMLVVSDMGVQRTASTNDTLAMFMLPAANIVVASRKEMTEVYDRFSDRGLQMLETPLWEAGSTDAEIGLLLHGDLGKFRYLFIQLLFPAYDGVRNAIATLEGTRDGVLVGIAVELYHREHEAWPKTLDQLSPRWVPELPVDRITGEPLHYKIIEDRPVVYSVGADRDDDGGRITLDANGQPMEQGTWPVFAVNGQPSAFDGDWLIWSTAEATKSQQEASNQ